jgi:hypothetical protein
MHKRYVVRLTHEERANLEALVRRGRAHARKLLYARILLKADASEDGPAWTDERIAEAFEVSTATVARERRRFCEDGLGRSRSCPGSPASPGGGCLTVGPRRTWWRYLARSRPRAEGAGR